MQIQNSWPSPASLEGPDYLSPFVLIRSASEIILTVFAEVIATCQYQNQALCGWGLQRLPYPPPLTCRPCHINLCVRRPLLLHSGHCELPLQFLQWVMYCLMYHLFMLRILILHAIIGPSCGWSFERNHPKSPLESIFDDDLRESEEATHWLNKHEFKRK